MKPFIPALLGSVLLPVGLSATAAQPDYPAESPVARSAIPGGVTIVPEDIVAKGLRASTLLETGIYNAAGERLGSVNDLVISGAGVVTVIIVSVEGAAGIGGKRLAIPRQQFSQFGERLVLPRATQEVLQRLPAYEGR